MRPMTRALRAVSILAVVSAMVLPTPAAQAATITAESVATGLSFPAGFTFALDGRIFYGERFTGEVRIFNPATSSDQLFFTIPNLVTGGEQGLLGIALDPDYPTTPYVYASVTRSESGVGKVEIVRMTDSGGTGSDMAVIFIAGNSESNHNGGRLLFGPDDNLYFVVGEKGNPRLAQRLGNRGGKVHRITAGGAVPSDNPFADRPVFAYGIRNSFGLAFDPATGRLWESENGPACNDELNRIVRGRNYGWGPSETCGTPPSPPKNTNQDGPNPVGPRRFYTPTIAPTGVVFCSSCGLGTESEGRLFFGAWNTGEIRRVTLNDTRRSVSSQSVVYTHDSGVLSMERGPDGALYFSDSDAIFRLALAP
jgi:glucose/arabinose dehydrogenase